MEQGNESDRANERKEEEANVLTALAWPPQVKEEEGWRQGCTRAAPRRKQFGEAVVAKLRGAVNSWRRWHPVRGGCLHWPEGDRRAQGPAPLVSNQGCRQ